jgi:hypothetical protein
MPEMSMSTAGHGSDGMGLLQSTLKNARGNGGRGGGMLAAITGAQQAQVAERMQGAQHAHERDMQGAQHGHERDLALIGGAVDIEKTKIGARAQVSVARAHGASQVDIARIQSDAAVKQQAAGHRHEQRMAVLNHNNGMEAAAAAHHNAVHASVVDSVNQMAAERQKNDHDLAVKNLADTHAANASSRSSAFLEQLGKHTAPGTPVSMKHEDVNVSFTSKPAEPAPAPAPEPTPEPEKNTKAPSIRDPKTGRAMRNPDYISPKKAPSVKEVTGEKAASKKKK